MSIIDLLKSPLAIAGIVGSVAIGGGLTVYVVRDGAMPGQSAPAAETFPGKFMVEVKFVRRRQDGNKYDLQLPVAYEKRYAEWSVSTYVHDLAKRSCNIVIDRQKGCVFELYPGDSTLVIRMNDADPSTVSIRDQDDKGYMFEKVSWEQLLKGIAYGSTKIQAFPVNNNS